MKESFFSIASKVVKPIYLDSTINNQTRPNCVRVKVPVELLLDFPKFVEKNIINPSNKRSRLKRIRIQYDMIPKYFRDCKIEGHDKHDCRVLHPKLKRKEPIVTENNKEEKVENIVTTKVQREKIDSKEGNGILHKGGFVMT